MFEQCHCHKQRPISKSRGEGDRTNIQFLPQYSTPKRSPPPPSSMQNPPNRELSMRTSDRMLRRWNNISIYNRAIAREREGANSKDSDRFHNFAIFILQTNFNAVSKLLKSVSLLGLGSPLPLTRWGPKAGTRPLALLLCNPGCTPPPPSFPGYIRIRTIVTDPWISSLR